MHTKNLSLVRYHADLQCSSYITIVIQFLISWNQLRVPTLSSTSGRLGIYRWR